MDRKEFDNILKQLEQVFSRAMAAFIDAAPILAKLSREQVRDVKRRYRGSISSEHIERLIEYGHGRLPKYLAMTERWLAISIYRRMPQTVRDLLDDADKVVTVYIAGGRFKELRLADLNVLEWKQVLDDSSGFRTLDQQRLYLIDELRETQVSTARSMFDRIEDKGNGQIAIVATDGSQIVVDRAKLSVELLKFDTEKK